jgi:hypothetical protein
VAKKVFKGWLPKNYDLENSDVLQFFYDIEVERSKKKEWKVGQWPPRRATVTVEVED